MSRAAAATTAAAPSAALKDRVRALEAERREMPALMSAALEARDLVEVRRLQHRAMEGAFELATSEAEYYSVLGAELDARIVEARAALPAARHALEATRVVEREATDARMVVQRQVGSLQSTASNLASLRTDISNKVYVAAAQMPTAWPTQESPAAVARRNARGREAPPREITGPLRLQDLSEIAPGGGG